MIICYFYMEQWNHTLEHLSLLTKLCSTSCGTVWNSWNQNRPPLCSKNTVGRTSCHGFLYHVILCRLCKCVSNRRHRVDGLKHTAVVTESPRRDDKARHHFILPYLFQGGTYGHGCIRIESGT